MLDIPYGDHFRIEAKWEVTETSQDTCRLSISLTVRFVKKTWFKSKIETTTVKETKTSFDKWVQLAKVEVQKMLQVKPLPSASSSTATNTTNNNKVVNHHNGAGSLTPTILIPSLNKSMDKNEMVARLKQDDERLESPKPHHTRSRSRQHLISSSSQVNSTSPPPNPMISSNNNNNNSNNSIGNIVNSTSNSSNSLQSQISPPILPNSPFNLTNNGADNNTNSTNISSDSIKSTFEKKNNNLEKVSDESGKFILKTPFGVLSFGSSQLSILVICSLLFILYSYMFMKILTLSSKIDTMESIFKDLINKNLNK